MEEMKFKNFKFLGTMYEKEIFFNIIFGSMLVQYFRSVG